MARLPRQKEEGINPISMMQYYERSRSRLEKQMPGWARQLSDAKEPRQFRIVADENNTLIVQEYRDTAWIPFHPLQYYYREFSIGEMNRQIDILKKAIGTGFVFFGLDAGARLTYLFENTPEMCPLFVVERHAGLFKAVLSSLDLGKIIDSKRVFFFVGEDAPEQLVRFIERNATVYLPLHGTLVTSADDAPYYREAAKKILQYVRDLFRQAQTWKEKARAYYAGLTRGALLERFTPSSARQVAVLGDLNTETRIMQHVTRSCMEAFQKQGHRAMVMEEGKVKGYSQEHYFDKVLGEYRPDVWFRVNHTAKEFAAVPESLVTVTWVLDPLYYLFNSRIKTEDKINAYDQILVIAKHFMTDDLERLGFPRAKLHHFYFGGNTDKYRPLALTDDDRQKYSGGISYVGNFHENEESYRVLTEGVAEELYARMVETETFYPEDIKRLLAEIEEKRGKIVLRPQIAQCYERALGKGFSHDYVFMAYGWLALSGAAVRTSYLEYIADLDARIYGTGWEKDPRFQRAVRGAVPYGDEVCKIFQATKINVNFATFTNNHPRVFDVIASGGFLLTRLTPEDEGPGGIGDLFQIGKEIEVFRNKKEMREKIAYYLAHDKERESIAHRGYERLMKEHTMEHRMNQLLDIVYYGIKGPAYQ